jgi:hypothetical protein
MQTTTRTRERTTSLRPSPSPADPATREADAAAVDWLLESDEPAIRGLTRRDLLDEPDPADDLDHVLDGPLVRGLLAGQLPNGDWERQPYRKWTGAHWRLVNLVELAVPPGEPRAMAALDRVLDWLTARGRLDRVRRLPSGLPLSDASIEGNALAVACRLGAADDPRAGMLADALLAWQWPDGGWNCDARASGRRSSFHESLIPTWALWEYSRTAGSAATGAARAARGAAGRGAELFLSHRLFRRDGTGERIHPSWTVLHYPPYWHYDVAQALHLLARTGNARDPRAGDALDLLEARRRADGRWRASAAWRNPPGASRMPEAVDWGEEADRMLTLNALRALRAGGRR